MAGAKRKAITSATQRALFDAAGRQCTLCLRNVDLDGMARTHIGEMGHIVPSSPKGPRSGMTRPSAINGAANLMLLCPSCHRTIDKAPALWPGHVLLAIKAEHEGWVAVERARPEPLKEAEEEPLGLGGTAEIDGVGFQIVPPVAEEWSDDGDAVISRAFALAPDGGPVWLRVVASRGPGPEALRWRSALAAEGEFLAEGFAGLPRVVAAELTPGTAALAVEVPSVGSMDAFYAGRGLAAETISVLVSGLAGLRAGLSALHSRGLSHGELTGDSIVADARGRLSLRDTGRAFAGGSAPADDVLALADLVHRIVAGRPPVPMVSASVLNPAVPEALARALARALSPDPAARGGIDDLGA